MYSLIIPGMLVPSDNDIVGQCLVESVVTVLVDNAVKTWFKKFVHVDVLGRREGKDEVAELIEEEDTGDCR